MSEGSEGKNTARSFFGWLRRSTEQGVPDQIIIEGKQATDPWVRRGVKDTGGVTVEGENSESGAVSILPIPSAEKDQPKS